MDDKEKQIAAWKLDQECKELTYNHSLQDPGKYFEILNDKIFQLHHLGVLKIDGDTNKITIAEHAFEKAVQVIAINQINAKWNTQTSKSWENYQ